MLALVLVLVLALVLALSLCCLTLLGSNTPLLRLRYY